jgi:hypothetical protein
MENWIRCLSYGFLRGKPAFPSVHSFLRFLHGSISGLDSNLEKVLRKAFRQTTRHSLRRRF